MTMMPMMLHFVRSTIIIHQHQIKSDKRPPQHIFRWFFVCNELKKNSINDYAFTPPTSKILQLCNFCKRMHVYQEAIFCNAKSSTYLCVGKIKSFNEYLYFRTLMDIHTRMSLQVSVTKKRVEINTASLWHSCCISIIALVLFDEYEGQTYFAFGVAVKGERLR